MEDQSGDFTIFGFTSTPSKVFLQETKDRLGVLPRIIEFGDAGRLFFYTTHGQVAESDSEIVLKLGFVRSTDFKPLPARGILEKKLIGQRFVNENEMRGNALIVALDKLEPKITAYKTLMSAPQLYYSVSKDGILCSDRMRALLQLLPRIELNEDILPMHFLFRTAVGSSTYVKNVMRVLPGQLFTWADQTVNLGFVRDLHFSDRRTLKQLNQLNQDALYEVLFSVVKDYAEQAHLDGNGASSLLSGGVDSSLIQHILNEINQGKQCRTYSFLPQAKSFDFEFNYVTSASQHFDTAHTFVKFSQDEYPELLLETVDHLAYPPLLPSEPGIYLLARYFQSSRIPERFYFLGGGAEPCFGYTYAKKIKLLQLLSRTPAFLSLLIGTGRALSPFHKLGRMLIERGRKVQQVNNSSSLQSPLNNYDVYINPELVIACFGEKATLAALEERRCLACQYTDSQNLLETAAVLDMVTDSYDIVVERNQIFLSRNRETINPFFDDDVIRMAFRFDPNIRYLKGFTEKYLLKNLLYQKTGLATAWKPKGGAQFFDDFYEWMRSGTLRPLVDDIELPGFITRKDFEKAAAKPDIFLWSILVLDLFKKRILSAHPFQS